MQTYLAWYYPACTPGEEEVIIIDRAPKNQPDWSRGVTVALPYWHTHTPEELTAALIGAGYAVVDP